MTTQLGDSEIVLPAVWDTDWTNLIARAEGAEQALLRTAGMYAHALKELQGKTNTPEVIAWITFWAQGFNIVEAALGAWRSRSLWALHVYDRSVSDMAMQLHVISEFVLAADADENSQDRLRKGLNAFGAFCIWSDLRRLTFHLSEDTLEEIYEPESARRFLNALGENAVAWQSVFGEVEFLSDQEAELERDQDERLLQERLVMLETWLTHPRLRPWRDLLDRERPTAFSAMFNRSARSVRSHLRDKNVEFAYVSYSAASALIHGTTVRHLSHLKEGQFGPRIGAIGGSVDGAAARIAESVRLNLLMLHALRPALE